MNDSQRKAMFAKINTPLNRMMISNLRKILVKSRVAETRYHKTLDTRATYLKAHNLSVHSDDPKIPETDRDQWTYYENQIEAIGKTFDENHVKVDVPLHQYNANQLILDFKDKKLRMKNSDEMGG